MNDYKKTYTAIFFSSMGALGFEVLLTRIFSISLWYHFAFMVVSISMLGLAASGTALAVVQVSRGKKPQLRAAYFLLLSVSMVVGYFLAVRIPFDPVKLSWDRMQLFYITLYYLTLSTPFFMAGLVLVSAFSSMAERSGILYGADLGGAAAGSIVILAVQKWLAPGQAVFFLASASLMGAFLIGGKRARLFASVFLVILITLIIINPPWIRVKMSPYKELPSMLQYSGSEIIKTVHSPYSRIDLFKSPGVRYAPGLSLKYSDNLPEQIGLAVDGGAVSAVTISSVNVKNVKDAKNAEMDFLKYLPAALAFEIKPNADVLVLNPKGGLPVLMAEHYRYGAAEIDRIEMNPVLVETLRNYSKNSDFGQQIYNSSTRTGFARSLLRKGDGRVYDIIDMPLTGTVSTGGFGGGEDYQLTVEAFEEYLGALNENGILNISLFIIPPYRAEFRLLTTVLSALDNLGVEEPQRHIAAIRSLGVLCLLVKRSPFNKDDIRRIGEFASSRWFDTIYYPGMPPSEANVHIRSRQGGMNAAFSLLINPESRAEFVENYVFDISPTSDESPFFHDYLRLRHLSKIYELVQRKWDFFIQQGYLVPAVFMQVVVIGFILVITPVFFVRRKTTKQATGPVLSYFGLIGMGFMFIEISMIQKLILVMEHPTYAVAVVLGSILVSAGMGSLAGQRFAHEPGHLWKITLAISLLTGCYIVLIPLCSLFVSGGSLLYKAVSVVLMLFPLGFMLGMPFPGGIRMLSRVQPNLIPWAWAMNGFFSVLAPVLSVMLAMKIGFSGVLWLAAAAYLGAFFMSRSFCIVPTIGTNTT